MKSSVVALVMVISLLGLGSPNAQSSKPVVGFLTSGSIDALNKRWMAEFHRALRESGFIDGQNVTIDYRAADDRYDRLQGLTAELVDRHASVIIAAGGPISALAAKKATDTVPIVFTTIADPVKSGLVSSFNRPGGNVTGTAGLTSELDVKRLEILHELKPGARLMGVLANPNRPGVDSQLEELQTSAHAIGLQLAIQKASTEAAIDAAFEALVRQGADGLVVTADPLFNFHRARVVELVGRYSIPAIYQWREFVEIGGLISYGPSIADAYYQAGVFAAKILKGAKPADLPVMQPSRFELVINLKTAKDQGIEFPVGVLSRADLVIE
jgi:putative ABC transport system substrate-binding protein